MLKKIMVIIIISGIGLFVFPGCEGIIPNEGEGEVEDDCKYVSVTGNDKNNGSINHPWRTIQYALDNAQDGYTIHVDSGVYKESIVFPSDRRIKLKSQKGALSTIIEGEEDKIVVTMKSCPDGTILDDFTITGGGNIDLDGGGIYIYNCSPSIKNNIITKNTSRFGGGITAFFGYYCSPVIQNNTIKENTAGRGGGISINCCSPIIKNNEIFKNNAIHEGGGIYIVCSGLFSHFTLSDILYNSISENNASLGGGIYIIACLNCNIRGNTILKNNAYEGGGLNIYGGASPTIQENIIMKNMVSENYIPDYYTCETTPNGGGIFVSLKYETTLPVIGGTSSVDTANFNTICGNTINQIYPNSYPYNNILSNCN